MGDTQNKIQIVQDLVVVKAKGGISIMMKEGKESHSSSCKGMVTPGVHVPNGLKTTMLV